MSDDVIENLAFDLVVADERIAALEADVAVYREVLCASLDALRDLTVRLDRLNAAHRQVANDYRRLREDLLVAAGAAVERRRFHGARNATVNARRHPARRTRLSASLRRPLKGPSGGGHALDRAYARHRGL